MPSDDPFEYETAFSLILSLQEQTKCAKDKGHETAEEISEKFSRLSKLTIGELEFARRMGFEDIPCIRISPYPILWREFEQPVPADFLITLNSKRYCVDVKYYDWKVLGKKIVIPKRKIDLVEKFSKYHKFDGGLVAFKRFEKWYLFNIDNFVKKAKRKGNIYEMLFSDLDKLSLLEEKHLIFNVGSLRKYSKYPLSEDMATGKGIYFKGIEIDKTRKIIKFSFSANPNETKDKVLSYEGIQGEVLIKLYEKIQKNMSLLYNEFDSLDSIECFTDSLPTLFTVCDDIIKINSVDKLYSCCLNQVTLSKVIFIDKGPKLEYFFARIYSIIEREMKNKEQSKKFVEE